MSYLEHVGVSRAWICLVGLRALRLDMARLLALVADLLAAGRGLRAVAGVVTVLAAVVTLAAVHALA